MLEGPRSGRIGPERDGRERVGTEVESEDLQDAERERNATARQCPHDEGRELRDVVGEVVREEAADVRERRATLLDRRDDRREVVVQQHEVGGFARDVRADTSHRDADVRLLERRAVVDAVAGHRDNVAPRLQRLRDPQLLLGLDPRRTMPSRSTTAPRSCRSSGRS